LGEVPGGRNRVGRTPTGATGTIALPNLSRIVGQFQQVCRSAGSSALPAGISKRSGTMSKASKAKPSTSEGLSKAPEAMSAAPQGPSRTPQTLPGTREPFPKLRRGNRNSRPRGPLACRRAVASLPAEARPHIQTRQCCFIAVGWKERAFRAAGCPPSKSGGTADATVQRAAGW
jgi:hypothetical protein